jgi:hypothetical protein
LGGYLVDESKDAKKCCDICNCTYFIATTLPYANRDPKKWYIAMPADTDTFNEAIFPVIGILAK